MPRIVSLLPLVLAAGGASAAEWFPPHPGQGETQYIIYADSCGESSPVGRPIFRLLDAEAGEWALEMVQDTTQGCFATPPPGSARVYAFEMPDEIEGVQIHTVHVIESRDHAGVVDTLTTRLHRPGRSPTPASIAGTWLLAGARHQGLLITMDESEQLAVSLNTYDAQGRPAWFSGSGSGGTGGVFTVPLTDTVAGAFLATPAGAAQARPWGEIDIDWQGCGRLRAAWRPLPGLGLAAGHGDFTQLTGALSAPCNLDTYAAVRNGRPQYVEYEVLQ